MEDITNIESYTNDNTALVWIETPSNPVLKVADISGAAELAKKYEFKLCVDNTFASPYLQNPLDLGADIVVHSATKYLGGHSDVVLGGVVCNDPQIAEDLRFVQNSCGAIPGPQDCFLVLRGIKTLHLRMQQHCRNGRQVAEFLDAHSKVGKVLWPGLPGHTNHAIAKKQMRDFGGMVSFSLANDSLETAKNLLSQTRIFALAESLGGVESLIGHPASMTHAAIPKKEREKSGVVDSLIRLSVGVEDGDDLVDDLGQALSKIA